jgi:flagellar assembly protein FliH
MTARLPSLSFKEPLRAVRLRDSAATEAENWEQWVKEREQAAYERGRRDGQNALSEQLVQQRSDLQDVEKGVLESLRQAVPQVVRDTEQAMISLALEVAQKLVAGLPISVEMVEAAVREALAQIEESSDSHVYLHPEDLEMLRRVDSSLLHSANSAERMHFHPAPEVARGGCLVKTHFGIIDAQRDTKVELLRKTLTA